MPHKKKILITGGIRSGKSQYALLLAKKTRGTKIFLATAEPMDAEMKDRIQKHRQQRNNEFQTIEEPLYLSKRIKGIKRPPAVIVIDCLTVWLNNLFYYWGNDIKKIKKQIHFFYQVLEDASCELIIVTNEVTMGVIPENKLARIFINELGMFNQEVARRCDEVFLLVSGIPQKIKGGQSS